MVFARPLQRPAGKRSVPVYPPVYIVDDDQAVRDSLSLLLESKGYAVRSFASAPEFLTAAASLPGGA